MVQGRKNAQKFYKRCVRYGRASRSITLLPICLKMMFDKFKLNRVNVNVQTKFGQILSIHSQDIERKRNSDAHQGP